MSHAMQFLVLALACALGGLVQSQGNVLTVDDGPNGYGGVWLFELNPDGTIESLAEVPLPDPVSDFDGFGSAVAAIGDLDGNGVEDLAVGAPGDDRRGMDRGAVWLLFRGANGELIKRVPLRNGLSFGEPSQWPTCSGFGRALAALGDLDGDGTPELAVGAPFGTIRSSTKGEVRILSLAPDGRAMDEDLVFVSGLSAGAKFGVSLASLGDFHVDGAADMIVGADERVRLMTATETPTWVQSITNVTQFEDFGHSAAALGDLNGDGTTDIAVGAPSADDGSLNSGAVWVLFLSSSGSVLNRQKGWVCTRTPSSALPWHLWVT